LPLEVGPDGFVQPTKLISATAVNARRILCIVFPFV
jgi:hypothetical protein